MLKRLVPFFITLMAVVVSASPAHAGIVSTAEVHQGAVVTFEAMPEKRSWLQQQLVDGGVEQPLAIERVAALTDSQVDQIFGQIDEQPAGGNALLFLIAVLFITEISGVTDLLPFIRPVEN